MPDPLWLTTEAGRLFGAPEYEQSEEAVFEELYCCGYLDRRDDDEDDEA